jgi:hypothetical protein
MDLLYTEVFINEIDFSVIVELSVVSLEVGTNTDPPHQNGLLPLVVLLTHMTHSLLASISFQFDESTH